MARVRGGEVLNLANPGSPFTCCKLDELSELRIRCSEQNVEIQDLSNKLSEKDQIATNLQEKFNLFVEQQENYEQNYVNMASETERKTAEINQLKQKFLDKDSDTNIAFNKLKLEKEGSEIPARLLPPSIIAVCGCWKFEV